MKGITRGLMMLLLIGVSSSVMAWSIRVYNKTPFTIIAQARSWGGALNGNETRIAAYQVGNVATGGRDCIDGMWVTVVSYTGEFNGLGYFKFETPNKCYDTQAVVGVEPQFDISKGSDYSKVMGGYATSGTSVVLKRFNFYVGCGATNVINAPAHTGISFPVVK